MDVKNLMLVIYVEAILYLLLYNLHDCALNTNALKMTLIKLMLKP